MDKHAKCYYGHTKCYYGETHLMLLWRNTLNVIMEKHTKCYYGETH